MPEFFVFLLKVNAALIVFCLAYYLVLRRLTFYTLNRFFLLAGIVFSSLYPLIDFSRLFDRHQSLIEPITTVVPMVYLQMTTHFDYWLLAKWVFWAGVCLMGCRLAVRFYALYKVHKASEPTEISNYKVRLLKGDVSTFSFWQRIYLNPESHSNASLETVLEHEQVHVAQWHTIDILLAELTTVFYWFNPGVWYMRKAVKENVEFITDQRILQNGIDRKAYQYSMLHTLTSGQSSLLINHFNMTGLKRRIIMMNKKRSSAVQLIRYVCLLPVVLVLTTAFTLLKTEMKPAKAIEQTLNKVKALIPSVTDEEPISVDAKTNIAAGKDKGIYKAVSRKRKQTDVAASDSIKMTSIQPQETAFSVPDEDHVKKPVMVKFVLSKSNTYDNIPEKKGGDTVRKTFTFTMVRNYTGDATLSRLPVTSKIYLNDKEITAEELKSISPADILNIQIDKKSADSKQPDIFLYSRVPKS